MEKAAAAEQKMDQNAADLSWIGRHPKPQDKNEQ